MKKFTLILFLFSTLNLFAQKLNFEKGTFAKALDKAKSDKKVVFLDVYASWCGPCKQLEKETYTDKKVAKFQNENFINFKTDAEKGEGIKIAEKFKVDSYPTLIFLNSNAEEIHRIVGFHDAEEFLESSKTAISLSKEPSLEALLREINNGKADYNSVKSLLNRYSKSESGVGFTNTEMVGKFIDFIPNKENVSDEDLNLIWSSMSSIPYKSKAYDLSIKNINKLKLLTEQEPGLESIVFENRINTFVGFYDMERAFINKDETQLQEKIKAFRGFSALNTDWFPNTKKTVFTIENDFYKNTDKTKYIDVLKKYATELVSNNDKADDIIKNNKKLYEAYLKQIKPEAEDITASDENAAKAQILSEIAMELNNIAWELYLNSDKIEDYKLALTWSKKCLELETNAAYLDTYAQLLYTTGNKPEGIKYQKKAIAAAKNEGAETNDFEATLKKMEAGEENLK